MCAVQLWAQDSTIIAGRVVDAGGAAVPGAEVVASDVQTKFYARATTRNDGSFVVRLPSSRTSGFVVFASKPEIGAVRLLLSTADATRPLVLRLQATPASALAGVRVRENLVIRPETVDRDAPFAGVGGGEQRVNAIRGALGSSDTGDPNAAAALQSGIVTGGGGISFLGSSLDQNAVLTDGLSAGAQTVPRLGGVEFKVITSALDIALGGFAGVAVNATPAAATRYHAATFSSLSFARDAPLRGTLPNTQSGGATSALFSFGTRRSILQDRIGVNASVDVRAYGTQAPPSFRDIAQYDSARYANVRDAARQLAVRGVLLGEPGATLPASNIVALIRLDGLVPQLAGLTGIASVERHDGRASIAPFAATSTGREDAATSVSAQVRARPTLWLGPRWRTELKAAARMSQRSESPLAHQPTVFIRVPDDSSATSTDGVMLGGSEATSTQRQSSEEFLVNTRRLWHGSQNTATLVLWTRLDQQVRDAQPSRHATVEYFQPRDVLDSLPQRLLKTGSTAALRAATVNYAVGAANEYRPTSHFGLYIGARLDASQILRRALVSTGAVVAPPSFAPYLSFNPRLGFDWFTQKQPPGWIQLAGPVADPFIVREPLGIFRMSIGRFAGRLTPETEPLTSLTAPQVAHPLSCEGSDIPAISWREDISATEAVSCRNSQAYNADRTIEIRALEGAVRAPGTWRSSASYSRVAAKVRWQWEARWARNVGQIVFEERGLRNTEAFRLPLEKNRPIFVNASQIDPRTGSLSLVDKVSAESVTRVLTPTNAGTSGGSAVNIQVSPEQPLLHGNAIMALDYTFTRSWARTNGYASTTDGDPRQLQRMTAPFSARHRVTLQAGIATHQLLVALRVTAQSGLPFTPLVGEDINGDGRRNDRAFVPTPHALADVSQPEAWGFDAAVPRYAKQCLQRSVNAIAASNSCQAPWSMSSQFFLESRDWHAIPTTPARYKLAVRVAQPVYAVLRALGSGPSGMPAPGGAVDPTFVTPVAFDTGGKRYVYARNRSFGRALAPQSSWAVSGISLDVTLDFTPATDIQLASQILKQGQRGEIRVSRAATRLRELYQYRMVNNLNRVVAEVLRAQPSRETQAVLMHVDQAVRAELDSLWRPVAERTASLSTVSDLKPLAESIRTSEREMWDRIWANAAKAIVHALSAETDAGLTDATAFLLHRTAGQGYIYVQGDP